jgi:tetratricopeptide (TPR) repeat protein
MAESKTANPHIDAALELANKAIAFDTAGNRGESYRLWQMASDYADEHLRAETIYYWIKSGLGAALFALGDYERAIGVSEVALDWCSTLNQPLPALVMAKSYLKLGDRESAATYVQHAYSLRGDAVFNSLDPADREEMRSWVHRGGAGSA